MFLPVVQERVTLRTRINNMGRSTQGHISLGVTSFGPLVETAVV